MRPEKPAAAAVSLQRHSAASSGAVGGSFSASGFSFILVIKLNNFKKLRVWHLLRVSFAQRNPTVINY